MAEPAQGPFERGPFLQAAALCEKVLHETDGVMSLIRIVDTITHTEQGPNAPQEMPQIRYPLTLVISLKAGVSRGRHEVTVTPELPSGETLPAMIMAVQMEGEARGVNLVAGIDIPYRMEGLYWFDVRFDGQRLTRVPLEVRYARLTVGQTTPGG